MLGPSNVYGLQVTVILFWDSLGAIKMSGFLPLPVEEGRDSNPKAFMRIGASVFKCTSFCELRMGIAHGQSRLKDQSIICSCVCRAFMEPVSLKHPSKSQQGIEHKLTKTKWWEMMAGKHAHKRK